MDGYALLAMRVERRARDTKICCIKKRGIGNLPKQRLLEMDGRREKTKR